MGHTVRPGHLWNTHTEWNLGREKVLAPCPQPANEDNNFINKDSSSCRSLRSRGCKRHPVTMQHLHSTSWHNLQCQNAHLKMKPWASLVAQWLRVCLPVQGTRVQALVWEDPTCRGATRPVSHNY